MIDVNKQRKLLESIQNNSLSTKKERPTIIEQILSLFKRN